MITSIRLSTMRPSRLVYGFPALVFLVSGPIQAQSPPEGSSGCAPGISVERCNELTAKGEKFMEEITRPIQAEALFYPGFKFCEDIDTPACENVEVVSTRKLDQDQVELTVRVLRTGEIKRSQLPAMIEIDTE
jgi:hypothetical protein